MEPCPIHAAMQWSEFGTRTLWGGGLVPRRALIIRQFHQVAFLTWTYFPFRRNSMKSSILAMSSIACVRQVPIYKTKMIWFYFDLTAHLSKSSPYWKRSFSLFEASCLPTFLFVSVTSQSGAGLHRSWCVYILGNCLLKALLLMYKLGSTWASLFSRGCWAFSWSFVSREICLCPFLRVWHRSLFLLLYCWYFQPKLNYENMHSWWSLI